MLRHQKIVLILLSFILLFAFLTRQNSLPTRIAAVDVTEAFSFSLENGFYQEDIQIAMSLPFPRFRHMEIRYTLDGSTPHADSPLYTAPITCTAEEEIKAVTVKAIVCDRNQQILGGPYTATYFVGKQINAWTNALVVSITTDADGLYSPEKGILYPMADCGPTPEDWAQFRKQNCKQRGEEWIRSAHMDIFEPDGSNVISQDIGLCVDGDHGSMTHYPYSLKVLADREYDPAHPSFNYDFFSYYNTRGTEFPHIQDFNNMVFRNGGNEYNAGIANPEQKGSMLRWNIGSRLADEAGYMVAGARPAMIFLNGELYSVAQLQDTYNKYNTASKTRLNRNSLEIFKDSERVCTKSGGYEHLYYSWPQLENSPILQPDNQKKLEETVSMDDLFSYYAFEILVNNTDYPKKNYAIWRYTEEDTGTPYADGKFRFLINDLDCTWDFRYDDDLWTACFHNIKENGTLLGSLIQVDKYRARFLNALCDLMNSGLFDREHLDTVINEANNAFNLIASHYYSPEDEAKRQQNVNLLKENAFSRKEQVKTFIQDTFHPGAPYTLSVKAPENGAFIRFSTVFLTAGDEDFQGTYYGDYPLTLSCEYNNYQAFACWKINGDYITTPTVTLDASCIQNGNITVELITAPLLTEKGLLISELYTGHDGPWIELYNASASPVHLEEYSLSNNLPAPMLKFHLPRQTLAPGETFVAGIDNTGVFRLAQGDSVYLTSNGIVADTTVIPVMAETESYGRLSETNEWRFYVHPTKGTAN